MRGKNASRGKQRKTAPTPDELCIAELKRRLETEPNLTGAKGPARFLDIGIAEFAVSAPHVVLDLLEGDPPSDDEVAVRARAMRCSIEDARQTLVLRLNLVRLRAEWAAGLVQPALSAFSQTFQDVITSPSPIRDRVILEFVSRVDQFREPRADWDPVLAMSLLRSVPSFRESLEATLSYLDALTGAGEAEAAAMMLSELIGGWKNWPQLDRWSLTDRAGRLPPPERERVLTLLKDTKEPDFDLPPGDSL
jgi:hypothetical protein